MDDINLHTDQMRHQNYPDPDIPAGEAWEAMRKILITAPGNMPHGNYRRGLSAKAVFYSLAGLIIAALITRVILRSETLSSLPASISYTQNKPGRDTLPDGTVVFLDNNSSIGLAAATNNQPHITVTGAAYFEGDKSGPAARFIKIGSLNVLPEKAHVYLSFDSAAGLSCVHVQSGTALIETNNERITLVAGESIAFDEKSKRMKGRQRADINLYAYATKIFEFNNVPLKDVAASVGKAYGVEMVVENNKIYGCRITTRFDNKSLKEILDILSYTLNIECQLDEKNKRVLLTGNGCE